MILWDVTTDQKFSISLAMPYSTHIFSIISTENRASLYHKSSRNPDINTNLCSLIQSDAFQLPK